MSSAKTSVGMPVEKFAKLVVCILKAPKTHLKIPVGFPQQVLRINEGFLLEYC